MPIKVVCSGCGRTLNARDEHAGKKLKCPGCAAVVSVPAAQTVAEALDELEPAPARERPRRDDDDDDRDRPARRDRDRERDAYDDRDDDRDYDRRPRGPSQSPFARQGLSNLGTILMFSGIGMLVLLMISTFFTWRSIGISNLPKLPGAPPGFEMPDIRLPGIPGLDTKSGIGWWGGVIALILAILAIVFVMVALFALNQALFKLSMWTAFGVSLVCAILAFLGAIVKTSAVAGLGFGPKTGIPDITWGGAWGAWVAAIVGLIAAGLFITTVLTMRGGAPRPRPAPVDDVYDED